MRESKLFPSLHTWGLIGAVLLLVGSCKTTKEVGMSSGLPKKLDKTLKLVQENNPDFNTLTISGKAKLDIPKEGVDIRLSYRMNILKDSLIWIRVSKLGIEAVRVMITPDSIFAIDNLMERFIRSGFEPAQKYTGLEVNFEILQDLLIGNLNMIPKRVESSKAEIDSEWLTLTGNEKGTGFSYTLSKKWLKLVKIQALNPALLQETEITYGGFETYGKGLLPEEGSIRVSKPEKVELDFTHSRVRVDPDKISVKFQVPKGYTLVSE